ncbi:MAG: putative homoprotocatechuate degradative operon repressor, transcriptional regulatory protein MarR [Gammaproteobacteria bacterium]|nr:putative homoprotocatechuate degradative operon repressor, transcriptional regulatory protein MarR [Gammaproteobacteria bacterium]
MSAEDPEAKLARKALPMRDFSESLPMALLRTREAVMCLFRPGLRGRGVTEQQWRILRALAHSGSMEVTALAEATFLLGPSLSRILPDMEKRQLVSRRQVDSDLRRSVVSLEPKGLRLIALHAPDSEQIYAEIAKRFGVERVTQLFTLLHELQDSLGEISRLRAPSAQRMTRKPPVRARKRPGSAR